QPRPREGRARRHGFRRDIDHAGFGTGGAGAHVAHPGIGSRITTHGSFLHPLRLPRLAPVASGYYGEAVPDQAAEPAPRLARRVRVAIVSARAFFPSETLRRRPDT